MKKSRRLRKVKKEYGALSLLLSLSVICICYFFIISTKAKDIDYGYNFNYTHVKLDYGDSLDSLAEKYNNTKLSKADYKKMIMEINKLCKEEVSPGCYLTVAYEVR